MAHFFRIGIVWQSAILALGVLSGCRSGTVAESTAAAGTSSGAVSGANGSASSGTTTGGTTAATSSTTLVAGSGGTNNGGSTVTSSAAEGGTSGQATGIAGTQASNSGPTPCTLFMHDDAYGNIKLGAVAVDQTHVYFAENGGSLLRRRIDGSDKAVLFGQWYGHLLGLEIALDQDYVYWLDNGSLVRATKAGGSPEQIALGGTASDVVATERYVYAATDGCLRITRIAHGTLDKEVIAPASVTTTGGGFTYLLLDGTDLYCANGPRVFVSHDWGPLELLTSEAAQPVMGIAVVNGELYWLASSSPIELFHYTKDGQTTQLGSIDLSQISRYIIADPPRKRVLFASGSWIISWSTETGEWKRVLGTSAGRGVTRDSNYFYWGRQTYTESSIERMPITQE